MNKQERDAIRAKYKAVMGDPYSPDYGINQPISPFTITDMFALLEHIPELLNEIERLETELATLQAWADVAKKWIPTIEDDGMEVYDAFEPLASYRVQGVLREIITLPHSGLDEFEVEVDDTEGTDE